MKSGYFGLITNPRGDFIERGSFLLGLFKFNFWWISFFYFSSCLEGRDLLGIILYFYCLKTSCWMFLCVERGR